MRVARYRPNLVARRAVTVALALAGICCLQLGALAAGWAIVPSPNNEGTGAQINALNGVACASATECWAVGSFTAPNNSLQTLIERWDGTSWSRVNSPNTSPNVSEQLLSVTCVSPAECWAVGDTHLIGDVSGGSLTFIELWDGSTWTIIDAPSPNYYESELNGVACAAADVCWAVGKADGPPRLGRGAPVTLIEQWDGVEWQIVASPNPLDGSFLNAVTCATSDDCWAVGQGQIIVPTGPGSGHTAVASVAEHWTGSQWTAVDGGGFADGNGFQLNGVGCVSVSSCWAVGGNGTSMRFEYWDGVGWNVAGPTSVSGGLNSVACLASSNCWAVGSASAASGGEEIFGWSGGGWAQSPAPTPGNYYFLQGVACASASACVAVGDADVAGQIVLVAKWDGSSWSAASAPSQEGGGTQGNELLGVGCASTTECWAVGDVEGDQLIEGWTGSAWSVASAPSLYGSVNRPPSILQSVACVPAGPCWAVGSVGNNSGGTYAVLEEWTGSGWVPQTTGSDQFNELHGVTCTSAGDCWAVGWSGNYRTSIYQGLIEHWAAGAWNVVVSPTFSYGATLDGVACAAANDCWAVGVYWDAAGSTGQQAPGHTVTEHWDGSSWTVVSSPNTASTLSNSLNAVTCASSNVCWAVGSAADSSGVNRSLIEGWDGTSWNIVSAPGTGSTWGDVLHGVACSSPTTCWAAGIGGQGSLIAGWSGSTWSAATSPNAADSQYDTINAVTCAAPAPCFIAGAFRPNGDIANTNQLAQTLIEEYPVDVPPASVTPATGSTLGGGTVTVNGSNLTGATSVDFGATPGTGLHVVDDNTLTVVAPPGSGTVNVTVTTPSGTSGTSSADQYVYVAPQFANASVASTRQFQLTGSDGAGWQQLSCSAGTTICSSSGSGDTMSTMLTPASDGVALLTANADLWTSSAGYNQDLGIFVSGGAYPTTSGQPEAWKESGGFAGTFSPNAVTVQTAVPVTHGVTYTIDVRWKSNKPTPAASIYAGAGPIAGGFSPTRLSAVVVPAANMNFAASTKQYTLSGNDGATWEPLDCTAAVACSSTGLGSTAFNVSPSTDGELLLSGNADLWTDTPGVNQDLGIFVNGSLHAWKESGGFGGTYSPNAGYVHTVIPVMHGMTYHVALAWKANKASTGAIDAGAGPVSTVFSPTSLAGVLLPSGGNPFVATSTYQYSLGGSDGSTWQPISCSGATTCSSGGSGGLSLAITPTQTCTAELRANVDLWTDTAGYNQDIAIFVNGSLVGWKESGGRSGAYSPNAAALEAVTTLSAGTPYSIDVRWKSNVPASGVTIAAGAGPAAPFSPSTLSAFLTSCA